MRPSRRSHRRRLSRRRQGAAAHAEDLVVGVRVVAVRADAVRLDRSSRGLADRRVVLAHKHHESAVRGSSAQNHVYRALLGPRSRAASFRVSVRADLVGARVDPLGVRARVRPKLRKPMARPVACMTHGRSCVNFDFADGRVTGAGTSSAPAPVCAACAVSPWRIAALRSAACRTVRSAELSLFVFANANTNANTNTARAASANANANRKLIREQQAVRERIREHHHE